MSVSPKIKSIAIGSILLCLTACGASNSATTPPIAPTPPTTPPPTPSSQQPAQPTDITPIDGEAYYVLDQANALQMDHAGNSTSSGGQVVQQPRSFTSLSQRWAFTSLAGNMWKIDNIADGFCLDGANNTVVENSCTAGATQQWLLTPAGDGYYTISSQGGGLLTSASQSAGTSLALSAASGSPSQGQLWLLRPVFFRGIDNALLEKQEAARVASGLAWWKDAGQEQDVLAILKNHGVNMVRLRPTSMPPYATQSSQEACVQNLCYAESDAQDLDLAKRAKDLGMSVELTLLFDGGSSTSVPAAWANDSLTQLQTDVYNYVKSEILQYRQAGTMPDLVSIGNEVDTGFLGAIGSPTGANFSNFASIQTSAMQAVKDAASDTALGPALPAPLTCIHITPAWDLTSFFTLANQNNIPYDAICQSYYPIFHGPLTEAQAAVSNPGNKPVEQDVLTAAANNIGKPIFIVETAEHYENGFDANDPWYSPPSQSLQRQFLIDVQDVQQGLPNDLGMGIEYWDPAGVNIPNPAGGFLNGDNLPNAIYTWNGLTLFDNADSSGTTNTASLNYSALLPGLDGMGGKLDPNTNYKFVNKSNGQILGIYPNSPSGSVWLDTAADNGNPAASQMWNIVGNNDGYFQISNVNPGSGALTDAGGSTASGSLIALMAPGNAQYQEWNVVSSGNGYFNLVNRLSGLVLDMNGGTGSQAGLAVQEPQNSSSLTQRWKIVAVQ
ncbi:MAG: glycosyl hydrolase 53 family protein [Acidobacteriaceae bacterium]